MERKRKTKWKSGMYYSPLISTGSEFEGFRHHRDHHRHQRHHHHHHHHHNHYHYHISIIIIIIVITAVVKCCYVCVLCTGWRLRMLAVVFLILLFEIAMLLLSCPTGMNMAVVQTCSSRPSSTFAESGSLSVFF